VRAESYLREVKRANQTWEVVMAEGVVWSQRARRAWVERVLRLGSPR